MAIKGGNAVMIRKRLYEIVEAGAKASGFARFFDIFMVCLIFFNVIAVTLETVESLHIKYQTFFYWFELFSVIVFSFEYVTRIWACVESHSPEYQHPLWGRLRFIASPMALVDLLAILPFYLAFIITVDLRFLRVFRLLRILKLTRYSGAMDTLFGVFRSERRSLFAAITIMLTLLVFLSGIVFFLEKDAQPEVFASIPHAMWWGMATLTTVGYGDVVPITVMGKLVGAVVTLTGLGMFALPAAILASGFAREAKRRDFTVSWNLVARVPLFSRLVAAEIGEIAELLRPKMAVPREVIVREGEIGDSMYFIVYGEVEVALKTGPVRLVKGDYFGEISILYEKPRMATITAVTSCQFLVLDGPEFGDLLEIKPELRDEIMATVTDRLTETDEPEEKTKEDRDA